jgi:hypothetical protein
MSNASITIGMPVVGPALIGTAARGALRRRPIRQFTSISRRHSVEGVIFPRILRGNYQHVTAYSSRHRTGGNDLSERIC